MGLDLLEGLSEAQAEVVTTTAAPLAVVAGPGAGKTRVLTRRIAWRARHGDADADHILVLTFSRRAAGELLGRLSALGLPAGARRAGLTAGTFHAVAWAQLARHRADRGQAPLGLLPQPARLARPALAGALGRDPFPTEVRAFVDELGWARMRGVTAATYGALAPGGRRLRPEVIVAAWTDYERSKHRQGLVDLDDLLERGATLLEDDADARAAIRWRHRHVFVDEYQDLNPAHLRLLKAWVGDRPDVCVVGDPDQAVYGFNGACPDLFDRVDRDWPGIRVVTLTQDFRSSPEIVAVTEAVRPAADGQPSSRSPRHSRRVPGPIPRVATFADEGDEAAAIAAAVLGRHGPGRGWSQMGVLARTNARLRVIATALSREEIPWRLRDVRPLADRPAVRGWLEEVGDTAPASDLREVVDAAPPSSDRDLVLTAIDEYLQQSAAGTAAGLRAWLDATGVNGQDQIGPGVDLTTFHRAKGLEWESVWVAGAEDGTVPLASASSTAAGLAEEQRLFYVALSRASSELTVSWVGSEPSRWIEALTAVTGQLSTCPTPPEQRSRLALLRGTLAVAPPRSRHAALWAWRDGRARAARCAPQAVLPDTVLNALASADAATVDELLLAAPSAGRRLQTWAPELVTVLAGA
jgi:DNA helicase II / ATP-dependent DNA helicase PcrA